MYDRPAACAKWTTPQPSCSSAWEDAPKRRREGMMRRRSLCAQLLWRPLLDREIKDSQLDPTSAGILAIGPQSGPFSPPIIEPSFDVAGPNDPLIKSYARRNPRDFNGCFRCTLMCKYSVSFLQPHGIERLSGCFIRNQVSRNSL